METIKQKIDRLEKELQEIKALKLAAEVEEEIPEYVECISSKEPRNFTVGKIYYIPNLVFTSNEGYRYSKVKSIYSFYPTQFKWKPSTKEAYEAQQVINPEPGKWYFNGNGKTLFLENEKHNNRVGFNANGDWVTSIGTAHDDTLRLASNGEVRHALLEYAKEKYKDTKHVRCAKYPNERSWTFEGISNIIYNNKWIGNGGTSYLFIDGKWAEIVEGKLEVNGYKIEKLNDTNVKVGCAQFNLFILNDLRRVLVKYGGTYVYKDGSKWTLDQIEKVLSVFDE